MNSGPYLLRGLLGVAAIVTVGILLSGAPGEETTVSLDTNDFDESVFLGGRDIYSNSQSFRGGEASLVMGGVSMDLRDAAIEGDEAVIEAEIVMGGIQLRVPRNWVVDVSEVDAFLGGVEDRTRPVQSEETKRLVVRGTVFMGGLQVRN